MVMRSHHITPERAVRSTNNNLVIFQHLDQLTIKAIDKGIGLVQNQNQNPNPITETILAEEITEIKPLIKEHIDLDELIRRMRGSYENTIQNQNQSSLIDDQSKNVSLAKDRNKNSDASRYAPNSVFHRVVRKIFIHAADMMVVGFVALVILSSVMGLYFFQSQPPQVGSITKWEPVRFLSERRISDYIFALIILYVMYVLVFRLFKARTFASMFFGDSSKVSFEKSHSN